MEEFYYQKMDRQKQAVYHGMLQGVRQLADQIQLPRVDGKELYDIFFQMRLDHPEIFWVVGFSWKYYPDSPNLIFVPEYLFEKGKIKEHQIALTSRVEKLARQAQGLSEWEKEKYVHDFICENVRYDKLKKPYSHEIIGPLGQGVGVCEGIAKAVKVLCDALGLWCMIAICGNNPEKGIKYRHTWNIVRIGGQYYHLDATFDNSLTRGAREDAECRYDYFNLDDKAMFRDHEPLIAPAPACTDNGHFYYNENGGGQEACAAGGKKRKSPDVSLARFVSDEGRAAENPGCAGGCRKRKIEAAPYLCECSAGGISGVVFRYRHAYAGDCAGRCE